MCVQSDFSSDDDSDSDYDSDENGGDACPLGCSNSLYEMVLELREKRADQEEVLSEFQTALGELKSMHTSQQAREKNVDRALAVTEEEIGRFQKQKQSVLNEIKVVVPLKLHQLQCLEGAHALGPEDDALIWAQVVLSGEDPKSAVPATRARTVAFEGVYSARGGGGAISHYSSSHSNDDSGSRSAMSPSGSSDSGWQMPKEVDGLVLVSKSRLHRLRMREGELLSDVNLLTGKLHSDEKHLTRLRRGIEEKKGQITVEHRKFEAVQRLKFGRLINLEVLDEAAAGDDDARAATTASGSRPRSGARVPGLAPSAVKMGKAQKQLVDAEERVAISIRRADRGVAEARTRMDRVMKENTKRLTQLSELTRRQQKLQRELKGAVSGVSEAGSGEGEARSVGERSLAKTKQRVVLEDDAQEQRKRTEELQGLVSLASTFVYWTGLARVRNSVNWFV